MAAKRCIPTDLFYNRKFMRLRSDSIRLMLIGLIADADDAGRGLADPDLLGRKLDQRAEQIEEALDDLTQAGFVQTYTVEEETYYFLRVWGTWQKLSKPTPSRYPPPPAAASAQGNPGVPREIHERPGAPRKTPSEGERGKEEKRTEKEGEAEASHPQMHQRVHPPLPHRVVPFPHSRASASTARGSAQGNDLPALTHQVARILNIPVTEALVRLVEDYAPRADLSLLGEADAAREWLDDPQHHQRASPAFFRRWLKRELASVERQHHALQRLPTGTGGERSVPRSAAPPSGAGPRPPDLMHLADDDQRARGENP